MIDAKLSLPAYELVLKAGHTFNLLDARGAISVTERAAYIGRVRNLARAVCQRYVELEQEQASAEAQAGTASLACPPPRDPLPRTPPLRPPPPRPSTPPPLRP